MGKPPSIAIPRWRQPTAERALFYAKAIKAAGGQPVFIDPGQPFDGFDGLLLMGGADIDPACYGEKATQTGRTNPKRDAHELAVLQTALGRDLPVLGICRGHQLLNVALGGKLVQHIEDHREEGSAESAWHEVELNQQSRLAAIYDSVCELRVNSRHHQGVAAEFLSPQLTAVACTGEIVEAIEGRRQRWVTGVQWHPERTEMQPAGGHLFRAFVEACRR